MYIRKEIHLSPMPCVHGLDEANWCADCKKKPSKRKSNKPHPKSRKRKSQRNGPKSSCQVCQARPHFRGARGKCKPCALKAGYKFCLSCKKIFLPKSAEVKFCSCRMVKKTKRSVWVVSSAGLPSLGKRR